MNLGLVACHFNPVGYRRPVENYWRFLEGLGEHAEHLTTIELIFDGDVQVLPHAIPVYGARPLHLLWQKEALLNIAISKLDRKYDAVAWIDGDVLFSEPSWYEQASQLLELHPLIQLFRQAIFLNENDKPIRRFQSAAHVHQHGSRNIYGHPGLAWAARREILEPDGLLDVHIVGGGDALMKDCWTGIWECQTLKDSPESLRRHTLRWGANQWRKVQGNLGTLNVQVRHLFHGARRNRRYASRTRCLNRLHFDPVTDITKDENGLLAWTGTKPALAGHIRNWFLSRREDG